MAGIASSTKHARRCRNSTRSHERNRRVRNGFGLFAIRIVVVMRRWRRMTPVTFPHRCELARGLVAVGAPHLDALETSHPRHRRCDERFVAYAVDAQREDYRIIHNHTDVTISVAGTTSKPSLRYSNGLTTIPRARTMDSHRIVASDPVVVRLGPRSTPAISA